MAKVWRMGWLMAAVLIAQPVFAREEIRAVGSSTVFPFLAAAAEQFGRQGQFHTPIVEVNGTGGGFKMFCEGVGERFPDIADASRPIKPSEKDHCAEQGVTDILPLEIGYDGIVFANAQSAPSYALTRQDIFLALAREVPKNGKLVPNFYTSWHQIDPALPDTEIHVYGPPPAEGTRDAFVELVMEPVCAQMKEFTDKQGCGAMREDGHFVELLGGNVMVQKLSNDHDALGIFSYSFLDQNRALVKANAVDGVEATPESITAHRYSVARTLYLYVKRAHIGQVPGLAEFVNFVASDAATGDDGFLVVKGLLPLASADHAAMKVRAASLTHE